MNTSAPHDSAVRLSVGSPVGRDTLWQLRHREDRYQIIATDSLTATVLATVAPDGEAGGGYSRRQAALAELIVSAPLLAQQAERLCDAFAIHEAERAGFRPRGDEAVTVGVVRDAIDYLRDPAKKPSKPAYIQPLDNPSRNWSPFNRDLEALQLRAPNTSIPKGAFPLSLPFKIGPSSDDRSLPWGEIYDGSGYDLLTVNSPALHSAASEPQVTALLRAVEVAPHLLVGSLRLIHSAQLEVAAFEIHPEQYDGFHREAFDAETTLGKMFYLEIGRVFEAKQLEHLIIDRGELAVAADELLRVTPRTPANGHFHDRLRVLSEGVVRSDATRPRTRDERSDQGVALRAAAELVGAATGDRATPTVTV